MPQAELRTAVALSGTFYFGLGDKWDETKLKPYPIGTFLSEPKATPHFVWESAGQPRGPHLAPLSGNYRHRHSVTKAHFF